MSESTGRARQARSQRKERPRDQQTKSAWTLDVRPHEPPTYRPTSLELWRSSLDHLRQDFLAVRTELGPLRCPLFQTSTSKSDPVHPPFELRAAASRGGSFQDFRWYVTRDGEPIYLEHPIVDAYGKKIVDKNGRGILCGMPTRRVWQYLGSIPAATSFIQLASRAGSALLGSPPFSINWIPQATRAISSNESRWVTSVFELAWQAKHPSLRAERRIWIRPTDSLHDVECDLIYVPYDLPKLRAMRASGLNFDFPEEWSERLPAYFVSELADVCRASGDLIDFLLSLKNDATPAGGVLHSGGGAEGIGARTDELTLAQAAREFDIPAWALSRAAKKSKDKPGHLLTRRQGSNVYVRRDHAQEFSKNFDARREQRIVGSKSAEGRNIIAGSKPPRNSSGLR